MYTSPAPLYGHFGHSYIGHGLGSIFGRIFSKIIGKTVAKTAVKSALNSVAKTGLQIGKKALKGAVKEAAPLAQKIAKKGIQEATAFGAEKAIQGIQHLTEKSIKKGVPSKITQSLSKAAETGVKKLAEGTDKVLTDLAHEKLSVPSKRRKVSPKKKSKKPKLSIQNYIEEL